MPYDFTMCGGEGCPIRNDCYRFRAIPASRQDWIGAPYDPISKTCEALVKISKLYKEEQLQMAAYHMWQREGEPEGKDLEHWNRAVQEVDERMRPPADLDD